MEKIHTVILGGGLAGLSAAYHGGGTVFEKEKVAGGKTAAVTHQGFTFDQGIHCIHSKEPFILDLLEKKLGNDLQVHERSSWIYSYQALTKYPFQANTFGLPIDIVRECLLGYIQAHHARGTEPKPYANYEEWIYGQFGKGIAEHFYIPYSEKFWRVPVREMTTDWLDVRIPMPNLEEVIEGALMLQKREYGPNAIFRYPRRDSIQALPDSFQRSGLDVRLGKEVAAVDTEKRRVTFQDGSAVCYTFLVNTTPLPDFVRCLTPCPGEVREAAGRLRHNSIFCVYLGIDREDLHRAHWIYYPEKEISFFRISFLKNFSSALVPPGRSSICAEVSFSKEDAVDEEMLKHRVVGDLKKVGVLKESDRILFVETKRLHYAYPVHDFQRAPSTFLIEACLKERGIYLAGRYGRWEYLWMHDVMKNGKSVMEEIQAGQKVVAEIRG